MRLTRLITLLIATVAGWASGQTTYHLGTNQIPELRVSANLRVTNNVVVGGTITGSGSGLTGVPDATRAVYVTTSPLSNSISGNATTATSATGATYATNLTDAGNILANTVPDARLAANIARTSSQSHTNITHYGTLGIKAADAADGGVITSTGDGALRFEDDISWLGSATGTNLTATTVTMWGNSYRTNSATVTASGLAVTNNSATDQGAVFGPNFFASHYGGANSLVQTIGGVGIGTTSPGAKLSVSKGATTEFTPHMRIEETGSMADSLSGIAWRNTQYGWDEGSINVIRNGVGSSWHMAFGTSADGSANVERVRMTDVGNVGIGTVSPTAGLHLTNASAQAVAFKVDTTAGAASFQVSSNGVTTANLSGSSNAVDLIASTGMTITTNTPGRTFTLSSSGTTYTNNTGLPGVVVGSGIGTNLTTLPTLAGANIFTASNRFEGPVTMVGTTEMDYLSVGTLTNATGEAAFFGLNGASLTNLTGANVTGTVPDATRASYVSGILTNRVANNGSNSMGILTILSGGAFTNLGTGVTQLGGPVWVQGDGSLLGSATFDGPVVFNDTTLGDGGGMTNLNASNVAGGNLSPARLPNGTNAWALNTAFPVNTNQLQLISGATTGGITGVSQDTAGCSFGEVIIKATGDIVFTNVVGIVTSDFVSSRTITNGNFAAVAINVTSGLATNLVIVQFR